MLSKRLKSLREEKQLTQKQFGEIFGLSESRYNQYENGRRSPDFPLIIEFAKYYDVTTDYLLGNSNVRYHHETIAAHHEGEEWTEEELKAIEDFKEFVKSKRKKK